MATVRKRERRMTLMSAKVKAVKREGQPIPVGSNYSVNTLSPSPLPSPSIRGAPCLKTSAESFDYCGNRLIETKVSFFNT